VDKKFIDDGTEKTILMMFCTMDVEGVHKTTIDKSNSAPQKRSLMSPEEWSFSNPSVGAGCDRFCGAMLC